MSQFFDRYPGARPWVFAASQAAAMLGISLKTLYNKLARFGLPPNRAASS